MHMGSKFVCPGMCLQLSTLAQTGLMFAMIALSVDQGKHSITDHHITLAAFHPNCTCFSWNQKFYLM